VNLLASTGFNDSFGMKKYIYHLLMKNEKWGEYSLKNGENRATQV